MPDPGRQPSRPTALFIHGAGGGPWEWCLWEPVFDRRGWHCERLCLEPAGSGLMHTTLADYEQQLRARIGALGDCVLVGASLGGLLALRAAEMPQVRALVLVNSVPPGGLGGWPAHRHVYRGLVPWSEGRLASTRRHLPDAGERMVRFAHRRWRDESARVMQAMERGVAVTPTPKPVLVLAGSQDSVVPPRISRRVAAWTGGDCHIAHGATHLGSLLGTHAPDMARRAAGWLAKNLVTGK